MEFIKGVAVAELSACENADSFLQSALWGRFKARFGWEAKAFSVDWYQGGSKQGMERPGTARPLLTLSRRIAPFLSMTYVPWGPELPAAFSVDPHSGAQAAQELALALRPFFPSAFIRFDLPWFDSNGGMPPPPTGKFRRAGADIQPPDTVLVDLTPSLDDILSAMKPKCRYNIGLAQKRGVVVRDCGDGASCGQSLEIFYRMLKETALRDGIAVHGAEYYRALFDDSFGTNHAIPTQIRLYIAAHEGDDLASIVALFRGKEATYLYGASSNIKRNLMAPYALQWKAMQDAKASGCAVYDLFGIPPDESPGHPMAGLYRFKTGFGGRIVHRPGSWDYPYKPILHGLFKSAESLRKKIMVSGRR